MNKNYDFKKEEDRIYAQWEKSGFFNPDNLSLPKKAKPFTIILPPPNITDKLHMGHAAMIAIEDLMIRQRRMAGYRALWIPGTDHASIATQNVVEKKLLKEKNKTRHDLGREKFLEEVWKFLHSTQKTILAQVRKMGGSLDWSREAFTLDKKRQRAVTKMFVEMYEAGLIYQGKRMVNWCPRCHSTLADDELEHEEQQGKLYTFKYSSDFPISISTTRPETKLGDSAVAVNPQDKRYKKYIGKIYRVNFCGIDLKIKIIADREVSMEFGTGALGVTPAHSFMDAQMGERNNLSFVEVIDKDGKIKPGFDKFSGKNVLEARKEIVTELKRQKLLFQEEEITNNLSVCYRCGSPIEPILSKQWFVAVDKKIKQLGSKSLKEKAIEVFKKKKVEFITKRFEKRYLDWMSNLHDWCISRQIWFGHSMPVWKRKNELNLILVRHAQTDWNVKKIMQGQTDVPLNKKGKTQAKELSELIKKEKIDTIIISPLKRTRQTAKIINGFGLKIIEDDRLKERSYGKFEGMKTDELLEKHPEITTFEVGESLYWIDVPTAETYTELRTRVREFIEDLKTNHAGKNVLIVSHGDTLDMFYAELNNLPDEKAYGKFSHNAGIYNHKLETEEIYVGEKKPQEKDWQKETDTLDTWFSSGMWTFSTLDWPKSYKKNKKSGDLKTFHPTQVMETGYDILTLWVSRMIMMSLFAVKEVPFEKIYLHGLILDRHGKKMCKSKGNGIDPVDMIKKYGADAVRLSLIMGSTPGNDVRIFEEKIEGFRNFVTKLWNIARFCQNLDSNFNLTEKIDPKDIKSLSDAWIVSRLEKLNQEVSENLENFNFSPAGEKLRDFTWNELADWYIEIQKKEKNIKILGYILNKLLRLWHPFVPFVTEAIYDGFRKDLLIVANWPQANKKLINSKKEKEFEKVQDIVSKIRHLRSQYKIGFKKTIQAFFAKIEEEELIEKLANVEMNEISKKPTNAIKLSSGKINFYADLHELMDIEKEILALEKEIANLGKVISQKEKVLQNKSFRKKASKEIVEMNQEKLVEYKQKLAKEKESLANLKSV